MYEVQLFSRGCDCHKSADIDSGSLDPFGKRARAAMKGSGVSHVCICRGIAKRRMSFDPSWVQETSMEPQAVAAVPFSYGSGCPHGQTHWYWCPVCNPQLPTADGSSDTPFEAALGTDAPGQVECIPSVPCPAHHVTVPIVDGALQVV